MTIIEIVFGSLVFVLSLISILLLLKIIKINNSFRLLAISYAKIEELTSLKNNDDMNNDVHKENFIKFLSDSRDWAYEYIKEVQDGLEQFINEIEPEISYFDEYGIVGDAYPHYYSMKKISSEYKNLKKLLPEE